jgi:hypothetical protein
MALPPATSGAAVVQKRPLALGYLAQAESHAWRGRRIVARQRQLIAQLGAQGANTRLAKELLGRFEQSLELFEKHLAELKNAVARHLDDVRFDEEVTDGGRRHVRDGGASALRR